MTIIPEAMSFSNNLLALNEAVIYSSGMNLRQPLEN
jgi:hypothetical protein